jgi:hypothetical protein
MKWSQVIEYAERHGLEIYSPLGGYHRNLQIIDRAANRHYWTANGARKVYQSLVSIVKQKQLASLTDEQAIAAAQDAKAFF